MGVLIVRALLFGIYIGALMFGDSHVRIPYCAVQPNVGSSCLRGRLGKAE